MGSTSNPLTRGILPRCLLRPSGWQSSPSSYVIGFSFSLLVLYALLTISRRQGLSAGGDKIRTNPGQHLMSTCDALLPLAFIVCVVGALANGGVPTMAFCQLQGFLTQAFATCQFACITGLMLERYGRLCRMRDGTPPRESAIWKNLKRFCWPLLIANAALPAALGGEYGAYGLKPNNVICFATAGRGVLKHDFFPVLNVSYFLTCTTAIVFLAYKSHLIIRSMFQSAAKEWSDVAAAAERRNLVYVLCLSASFLASWTLCAVHFFMMSLFGVSMDWPPIFFDLTLLTISGGCCLSPIISVSFDANLRKLMLSYFGKVESTSKVAPLSTKTKSNESTGSKG
jgi:hypothetical protein